MIELANGHKFDFACASGALAFDGRGWPWEWPVRWTGYLRPEEMTVVAKTVTMHPRKGNLRWWHPWTCFRLLPNGNAVNAIGLTNPGIEYWVKRCYPIAKRKGYNIAASVMPNNIKEAALMGKMLKPLDLAYIEINISCPNLGDEHPDFSDIYNIIHMLGNQSDHPVVVKFSYEQAMCKPLIETLVDNWSVAAFHAINTVPWNEIFKDKSSPLTKYTGVGGGISGPKIIDYTVKAISHIKQYCEIDVIAGGGVSSIEDCRLLESIGANAFSIGTLFIREPWRPNEIILQYRQETEVKNGICGNSGACNRDSINRLHFTSGNQKDSKRS